MILVEEKLTQDWRSRLLGEAPEHQSSYDGIICWLLGENPERLNHLNDQELLVISQGMDYRWRILQQRYLGVPMTQGYNQLIRRLASLFLVRNKIRTWVALSRDRQRTVVDVIQEVVQEVCQRDRYMQKQVAWIGQCTEDSRLRNALLLASLEEYCLRPVRNQPLLTYRFFNYLRQSGRAGLTHVPDIELIRLVSQEITTDDSDDPVSLLDEQAIAQYEDRQAWEEQQRLRQAVCEEFADYLAKKVDPMAAKWLHLYLQGRSQEAIAQELNLPIKQIYRLREKISYHAIRIFSLKIQPELVTNWLQTSLTQHSLGLTPTQWQKYLDSLTPIQRQVLSQLKAGQPIKVIATSLHMKTSQVLTEWTQLYLTAQSVRNS
jgi:hypothetical protein